MLTQERLKELFDYHEDGYLIWKKSHQKVKTGDKAGCFNGEYIRVKVGGKNYLAHRLIFLWHHGYMPKEIDHHNENKLDNKIQNLREATNSQNQANRQKRKSNTSGFKGVHWHKPLKCWRAQIGYGGKKLHIGYFGSAEEAHAAYVAKSKELFREFAST